MYSIFKKTFMLSTIKHLWLLVISMALFVFSLYNNKINPDIDFNIELATYGVAIVFAFVWSILNYISQIKINSIYKKNDNIEAYVNSLMITKEEKNDLCEYLNDFVKDLETNGKTKSEAVKIAIAEFQVKEFTSQSKYGSILDLPVHYYLFGYVALFIIAIIITQIITIFIESFLLKAIIFTLGLYAISFIFVFILYKIIDNLIVKKL